MSPRELENHFLECPASDARTSCLAIKDELCGKLVFDDPRVFQQLGIDRVSVAFTKSCASFISTSEKLRTARSELWNIVQAADGKPDPGLEACDDTPFVIWQKGRHPRCTHHFILQATLFQHIESYPDPSGTLRKATFVTASTTTLKSDPNTWGFPKASPDFSMIDLAALSTDGLSSDGPSGKLPHLWRHRSAFCEIKASDNLGPKPQDPHTITDIVSQSADYARLHLAARPFQLFSVGLLVFGSSFCVAIFDRDVIQFSPIHHMWIDLSIFIRVVRCLTYHMSHIEFGQDPTARMLSNVKHEKWIDVAYRAGLEVPNGFPSYKIPMGGTTDTQHWSTIGLPIWTSVSLLGRGTAVWRVYEASSGAILVMKNAWRSGSRISESRVYESIHGDHPGVADYHSGGDVMFPGDDCNTISVRILRDGSTRGGEDSLGYSASRIHSHFWPTASGVSV